MHSALFVSVAGVEDEVTKLNAGTRELPVGFIVEIRKQ
jgi:hypothetical protein